MDQERLKAILESLLFAAGEPVSLARLAAALENVPKEEIRQALATLAGDCIRQGRGVVLTEVAGGYQLRTAKEHALYVRKLLAARPPRLSRPILESLAIIAYRQPITRPEIEQLRGVDSGAVLETLLERRLIRIAGRKEAPGRPLLYATTPEFLETFGLKDLDSLPDLNEMREVEQQIETAEQQRAAEMPDGEQLGLADSWTENAPPQPTSLLPDEPNGSRDDESIPAVDLSDSSQRLENVEAEAGDEPENNDPQGQFDPANNDPDNGSRDDESIPAVDLSDSSQRLENVQAEAGEEPETNDPQGQSDPANNDPDKETGT